MRRCCGIGVPEVWKVARVSGGEQGCAQRYNIPNAGGDNAHTATVPRGGKMERVRPIASRLPILDAPDYGDTLTCEIKSEVLALCLICKAHHSDLVS